MNDKKIGNGKKTTLAIIFLICLCLALVFALVFHKSRKAPKGRPVEMVERTVYHARPPDFIPKAFINLEKYSNAGLKTNWLGGEIKDRSLADLPDGTNVFGGATFRVEGLIQLQGTTLKQRAPWYPDSIKGIPVEMTCSNLHFLQGTAWSTSDGSKIGAYEIHFADGSDLEFPIIYGADVRDWSFHQNDPYQETGAAWFSKQHPLFYRLYTSTWQNPHPSVEIKSIDYVSSMTNCAPFLLGITAE
jgi:hypothetical protein